MKITSLERQKKDQDRLNLYIDGVFYCGLNTNTAAKMGLYEGKEVTSLEICNIDSEDEYQKCMNSSLNLVSRRMQSECEYWQKLGKKYDKAVIGRCLARLRVLGYANDRAFAAMWVRERSNSRGNRLLRVELKQKGIAKDIIDCVLSQVDEADHFEVVLRMATRKFRKDDTKERNNQRIMSFLTRKGYGYQISKEIVEIIYKTTD